MANNKKFKKNTDQNGLKQSPKATFGSKYKWFNISYLEFFFWKYNFNIKLFYIPPHIPVDIIRVCFFNFQIFERSPNQKILAKKITHFIIQFPSKNLTHFANLNPLDFEINMLRQHSQRLFRLCKFWSTDSKFLYIFVYLRKKIFVSKT